MRITQFAQASIFENYSEHEFGVQLKELSRILDLTPEVLSLVESDLIRDSVGAVGRIVLSVESVFRCLLLKQRLGLSYEQLAFHLSDSMTYRTFTRLPNNLFPSRSGLQSTIRKISPETMEKIHLLLSERWWNDSILSMEKIRIDSTVVASNIAPPSDSQLSNDGVRVLSRLLMKSKSITGISIRFKDQRKKSKSLTFRIFNAKNSGKEALYPDLLKLSEVVINQVDRALTHVDKAATKSPEKEKWIQKVTHYRGLMLTVIDQTKRRVVHKETVHTSEKIVTRIQIRSASSNEVEISAS